MNSIGINTKRGTITATVLKAMHYRNNIFRVCFENGYENIFYTNVENGKWIEEDLGYTLLAELVGTQINKLLLYPVHVPKILTWQYSVLKPNYRVFGYYAYHKGNCLMFEIYNRNNKYLYPLQEIENEEWQILHSGTNTMHNINRELLEFITSSLSIQD